MIPDIARKTLNFMLFLVYLSISGASGSFVSSLLFEAFALPGRLGDIYSTVGYGVGMVLGLIAMIVFRKDSFIQMNGK